MKKFLATLVASTLILVAVPSNLYSKPILEQIPQTKSAMLTFDFGYFRVKKFSQSNLKNSEKVLITAIVDGDTLTAQFSDGKERQIRLLGINTPEVTTKNYDEQCFGAEATAAIAMYLKGGRYVYLKSDATNRDEDDFGRKLRYVYVPIINSANQYADLSELLVAHGYALVFREYPSINKKLYLQHELNAKKNELGIWSECAVN